MCLGSRRRDRARTAGFTLVELLTVVAIMGILAALAIAGVRLHLKDAKAVEATATIQAIRAAQEARRSELGLYLNCSAGGANWYPAAPNGTTVRAWIADTHADAPCWRMLGVSRPDGVRFGYLASAGIPGQPMTNPQTSSKPPWATPVDPWFVIQAAGDTDSDTNLMLVLASSVNSEIYVENEGE